MANTTQKPKRPHPKCRRDVWIGIREDGRHCGHQHVTPDRAKDCLMGQGQTIALMTGRAKIQRLPAGDRQAVDC